MLHSGPLGKLSVHISPSDIQLHLIFNCITIIKLLAINKVRITLYQKVKCTSHINSVATKTGHLLGILTLQRLSTIYQAHQKCIEILLIWKYLSKYSPRVQCHDTLNYILDFHPICFLNINFLLHQLTPSQSCINSQTTTKERDMEDSEISASKTSMLGSLKSRTSCCGSWRALS